MTARNKHNLAKTLQISTGNFSDLLGCRRNASYPLAKKISKETGSSIELWVLGGTGTSEARRAAVEKWAAHERGLSE